MFTIWVTVLLAIGMKVKGKLTTGQAVLGGFLMWWVGDATPAAGAVAFVECPKEARNEPGSIIIIVAIIAFVGFLAWTTLSAQKATCTVCVEFNGRQNCATASHENEAAAAQSAQQTACGPVASGMDQTIACGNRPPVSKQCRTK